MKTSLLISILFCLIAKYNLLETSSKRTRVLLIGIDGFIKECYYSAKTYAFEYIIQNGSSSFAARTAIEAFGAPGWSSILCGMNSESSGISTNQWIAPWISHKPNPITPISGNDKPIPCIFEIIKKQNPNKKTAAIFSRNWFLNFGNESIPKSIDIQKFCEGEDMENSIRCDQKAIETAKEIITSDFDFFFLFLGSLDRTGHEKKFCSADYIKRLSNLNDLLIELFEKMREEKILDDTYIIITSDHGASFLTNRHGDQDEDNMFVPWLIKGPNIKKNHIIQIPVNNVDTASTIIKIFNLNIPELWTSKPIKEIFESNPFNEIDYTMHNSYSLNVQYKFSSEERLKFLSN